MSMSLRSTSRGGLDGGEELATDPLGIGRRDRLAELLPLHPVDAHRILAFLKRPRRLASKHERARGVVDALHLVAHLVIDAHGPALLAVAARTGRPQPQSRLKQAVAADLELEHGAAESHR